MNCICIELRNTKNKLCPFNWTLQNIIQKQIFTIKNVILCSMKSCFWLRRKAKVKPSLLGARLNKGIMNWLPWQISKGPYLQLGFCVHCGGMIIMYFSCVPQSLRLACRSNIQQHNVSIHRVSLSSSMCTHNHLHSLIHRRHMHAGTQNHTYTLRGKRIMELRLRISRF